MIKEKHGLEGLSYNSVPQSAQEPSARLSPFCQSIFYTVDSKMQELSVPGAALSVLRRGDNNFPQYAGFALAAPYTDRYAASLHHC